MSIELTPQELKLATDAARRAAWKWPNVEAEEVAAHLWEWLCKHYKTVLRYRTLDMGVAMLSTALKREATSFCVAERSAIQSVPLGKETDYDRGMVERTLPYIWDYADWHQSTKLNDKYDIALAILSDVSQAYYALGERDRDIIAWRHRDRLTHRKVANMLDSTEESARKRYSRAIDRLMTNLGGVSAKWDGTTRIERP